MTAALSRYLTPFTWLIDCEIETKLFSFKISVLKVYKRLAVHKMNEN